MRLFQLASQRLQLPQRVSKVVSACAAIGVPDSFQTRGHRRERLSVDWTRRDPVGRWLRCHAQILTGRFGAVSGDNAGLFQPDDARPVCGMNCFAEIVAVCCLTGGANPFLPGPRSRDAFTGWQRVQAVPADQETKEPECDKAHSEDDRDPEQDLPAYGIACQATENPQQESLQPSRQALAK